MPVASAKKARLEGVFFAIRHFPPRGRTVSFAHAAPLRLIGVGVLVAMWVAHFALFRGDTLAAWFGLTIVTSNAVSSLFNSHLFDFTQGWLYVFGVGVTGGMVLRRARGRKG
jgi:O-antigen ligase